MARCRLTLEQYRRLLEAFREEPGNAARAARIAEVDPRTALRAWHRGWIAPPWARCIEQVVDEEHIAVRARARELAREEERKTALADATVRIEKREARADAVDDRARELQASRSTLSGAMTALGVVGLLSKPVLRLAERLAKLLEGEIDKLNRDEAFALLSQYNVLLSHTSLVAKRAVETARLVAGAPQRIIGHKVLDGTSEIPIQPEKALDFLGSPERVARAAKDLFEGNLTPDALILVESQAIDEARN